MRKLFQQRKALFAFERLLVIADTVLLAIRTPRGGFNLVVEHCLTRAGTGAICRPQKSQRARPETFWHLRGATRSPDSEPHDRNDAPRFSRRDALALERQRGDSLAPDAADRTAKTHLEIAGTASADLLEAAPGNLEN